MQRHQTNKLLINVQQYWLFKSEPNEYGWQHLLVEGSCHWDGVRNHQAANNMRKMKLGDLGFFYHSVKERNIVGIVEVIKEFYPDYTDPKGKFIMVDVKPIQAVKNLVNLAQIKAHPKLQDMALVKQPRLSVCPVTLEQWNILCEMAGLADCH